MCTVIGDTITISRPSVNTSREPSAVKSGTEQKSEAPVNIQFLPFRSFYPGPAEEKIDTSNLSIKKFIGDDGSPYDAKGYVSFERIHLSFRIHNYDGFQEQVIKKAEQLGYTRGSLSNLSVHAAVEVASFITASQLHADLKYSDTTSLDKESADAIFRKGEGVCRHYAMVNCAVFQIIKDLNPALKNTYMAYFTHSEEIADKLPHAWNEVISLTKNKVVSTFVDPTWFNQSPILGIGNLKIPIIFIKEISLNAYDLDHFGKDYSMLDFDLARYYETMARTLYCADEKDISKECSEYFIKSAELYGMVLKNSDDAKLKSVALENEMWCYCALEEYTKAQSLLDGYVIKHPTDANKKVLWSYLNTIDMRPIDPKEKKELLKMTLQTLERIRYRSADPASLSELAKIYIEIGDAKTGIEMFRELVKANPKKNWIYLKFAGQCLERCGYADESKRFYREFHHAAAETLQK